jgi:hypothetical protein
MMFTPDLYHQCIIIEQQLDGKYERDQQRSGAEEVISR